MFPRGSLRVENEVRLCGIDALAAQFARLDRYERHALSLGSAAIRNFEPGVPDSPAPTVMGVGRC
jgi:hypothetical protein